MEKKLVFGALMSFLMLMGVSCNQGLDIRISPPAIDSMMVEFRADGKDADLVQQWSWDFGDGTTGSGNPTTHPYEFPGTYSVTLIGKDGTKFGFADTIVSLCPTVLIPSFENPTCTRLEINIPIKGDHWKLVDWGDGTSDNALVHDYYSQGSKLISIKYLSIGCSDTISWSDSRPVGVNPGADFEVTHVGLTADFETNPAVAAPGYEWRFSDGFVSYEKNVRHPFPGPGNYTVTLIAKGSDCTMDVYGEETFYIPPAQEPYLEPFEDSCECAGAADMNAPSYYYGSNIMLADCLKLYGFPRSEELDIVGDQPTIKWKANQAPSQYQVVIITKNRPHFEGETLSGVSVGDWMWTSAMSEGRNGVVEFHQGRRIKQISNNTPEFEAAIPLTRGALYYWMVYAFTENGSRIGACTRIHPMRVGP